MAALTWRMGVLPELEVLDSVVVLDSVAVMDALVWQKRSAEMSSHNEAVL
jgi:hypothetical protein